MTIRTAHSEYVFTITEGKLQTRWGNYDVVVNRLDSLEIGKRLYVSGYKINPSTHASPITEIAFRTSEIKEILP